MNDNESSSPHSKPITITAAKIPTGYRVNISYVSPTTTRYKSKVFTLPVNKQFREGDKWNVDIVIGAALRLFTAVRVEDIHEKFTSKGLANQLYRFLKLMTKRKAGDFLIKKYEAEGRAYRMAKQDPATRNLPHLTQPTSKVPTNSGASEGDNPKALNKEEPLQLCRELEERSTPIPSTSIFTPEPTGATYAVMGKSFSGKTTFIVNELNKLTEEEIRKYNAIVFFTESAHALPLKDLSPHVREKMILTDSFCPMILQVFKKLNDATGNMFKFLVLFDDIIKLKGELLTQCILTLRNANISTAISVQDPKMMNPAQRSSVHNMYLFNLKTERWDYMLRDYLLTDVKAALPSIQNEKRVSVVAQKMHECMNNTIIYYDQRRDKVVFWKKRS